MAKGKVKRRNLRKLTGGGAFAANRQDLLKSEEKQRLEDEIEARITPGVGHITSAHSASWRVLHHELQDALNSHDSTEESIRHLNRLRAKVKQKGEGWFSTGFTTEEQRSFLELVDEVEKFRRKLNLNRELNFEDPVNTALSDTLGEQDLIEASKRFERLVEGHSAKGLLPLEDKEIEEDDPEGHVVKKTIQGRLSTLTPLPDPASISTALCTIKNSYHTRITEVEEKLQAIQPEGRQPNAEEAKQLFGDFINDNKKLITQLEEEIKRLVNAPFNLSVDDAAVFNLREEKRFLEDQNKQLQLLLARATLPLDKLLEQESRFIQDAQEQNTKFTERYSRTLQKFIEQMQGASSAHEKDPDSSAYLTAVTREKNTFLKFIDQEIERIQSLLSLPPSSVNLNPILAEEQYENLQAQLQFLKARKQTITDLANSDPDGTKPLATFLKKHKEILDNLSADLPTFAAHSADFPTYDPPPFLAEASKIIEDYKTEYQELEKNKAALLNYDATLQTLKKKIQKNFLELINSIEKRLDELKTKTDPLSKDEEKTKARLETTKTTLLNLSCTITQSHDFAALWKASFDRADIPPPTIPSSNPHYSIITRLQKTYAGEVAKIKTELAALQTKFLGKTLTLDQYKTEIKKLYENFSKTIDEQLKEIDEQHKLISERAIDGPAAAAAGSAAPLPFTEEDKTTALRALDAAKGFFTEEKKRMQEALEATYNLPDRKDFDAKKRAYLLLKQMREDELTPDDLKAIQKTNIAATLDEAISKAPNNKLAMDGFEISCTMHRPPGKHKLERVAGSYNIKITREPPNLEQLGDMLQTIATALNKTSLKITSFPSNTSAREKMRTAIALKKAAYMRGLDFSIDVPPFNNPTSDEYRKLHAEFNPWKENYDREQIVKPIYREIIQDLRGKDLSSLWLNAAVEKFLNENHIDGVTSQVQGDAVIAKLDKETFPGDEEKNKKIKDNIKAMIHLQVQAAHLKTKIADNTDLTASQHIALQATVDLMTQARTNGVNRPRPNVIGDRDENKNERERLAQSAKTQYAALRGISELTEAADIVQPVVAAQMVVAAEVNRGVGMIHKEIKEEIAQHEALPPGLSEKSRADLNEYRRLTAQYEELKKEFTMQPDRVTPLSEEEMPVRFQGERAEIKPGSRLTAHQRNALTTYNGSVLRAQELKKKLLKAGAADDTSLAIPTPEAAASDHFKAYHELADLADAVTQARNASSIVGNSVADIVNRDDLLRNRVGTAYLATEARRVTTQSQLSAVARTLTGEGYKPDEANMHERLSFFGMLSNLEKPPSAWEHSPIFDAIEGGARLKTDITALVEYLDKRGIERNNPIAVMEALIGYNGAPPINVKVDGGNQSIQAFAKASLEHLEKRLKAVIKKGGDPALPHPPGAEPTGALLAGFLQQDEELSNHPRNALKALAKHKEVPACLVRAFLEDPQVGNYPYDKQLLTPEAKLALYGHIKTIDLRKNFKLEITATDTPEDKAKALQNFVKNLDKDFVKAQEQLGKITVEERNQLREVYHKHLSQQITNISDRDLNFKTQVIGNEALANFLPSDNSSKEAVSLDFNHNLAENIAALERLPSDATGGMAVIERQISTGTGEDTRLAAAAAMDPENIPLVERRSRSVPRSGSDVELSENPPLPPDSPRSGAVAAAFASLPSTGAPPPGGPPPRGPRGPAPSE